MNSGSVFGMVHRAMQSGLWGLVSLVAVNVIAAFTGVSLGFGWLSGGTAAVLGVPGVVGLLVLNALFAIV